MISERILNDINCFATCGWVNAPSALQVLHYLDGKRVAAFTIGDSDKCIVCSLETGPSWIGEYPTKEVFNGQIVSD